VVKRSQGKSAEELGRELQYTKENLQTTIEELETSNEELKSTNEELQSTNEELQSTNEEMETSKEELQSLNEESATVNAELQSRIDELSQTNDDMKNLLDSTNIATLFLDIDLCIRRFTPKATEIVPLAGTDSGRPIKHFATSLIDTDLSYYGTKVLGDLAVREVEIKSRDGFDYLMKIRPYRTVSNVIDGVVITFEDITSRKKDEAALTESEQLYRTLFELANDSIVLIDGETGKITESNQVAHQHLGYNKEEFLQLSVADIEAVESTSEVTSHIQNIIQKGKDTFETQHKTKEGDVIHVLVKVRAIHIRKKPFLLSTWYDLDQ